MQAAACLQTVRNSPGPGLGAGAVRESDGLGLPRRAMNGPLPPCPWMVPAPHHGPSTAGVNGPECTTTSAPPSTRSPSLDSEEYGVRTPCRSCPPSDPDLLGLLRADAAAPRPGRLGHPRSRYRDSRRGQSDIVPAAQKPTRSGQEHRQPRPARGTRPQRASQPREFEQIRAVFDGPACARAAATARRGRRSGAYAA